MENRGAETLSRGRLLVLHPQVIHGSGSNVSGKEGMAMAMSYRILKPEFNALRAGVGTRFIKDGKKTWEPLPVSG